MPILTSRLLTVLVVSLGTVVYLSRLAINQTPTDLPTMGVLGSGDKFMNKILQTIIFIPLAGIAISIIALSVFYYATRYVEQKLFNEMQALKVEHLIMAEQYQRNYEHLFCITKCYSPYYTPNHKRESCMRECQNRFEDE